MKSREQIEAELRALGWKITGEPSRTSSGWKATMQRGTSSVLMTNATEIAVLEDLLRFAKLRAGRKP